MPERRVDVFFYGLFMDQQLLEAKGVQPIDIRAAVLEGYALRIGVRAALVPTSGARVHGLLMRLSHAEVEKLYSEPSVQAYRPEPVLARVHGGEAVAALCYNLPEPPSPDERNAEYASKLRALATHIGLPADYVSSIK